ncbi:hypothetical protein A3197_17435 [Candidatus Thiodiazotropha endoloripes]|nr:hypothetical protein A3197_17435 [Candidatus Thiodiazotropha endoloripes]
MDKCKIEDLEKIAVSAFKANAELSGFIEDHAGEFSIGIVEQGIDEPFRIDLYWCGPKLDESQLKHLTSTADEISDKIAYCEVGKQTNETVVKGVKLPKE